MKKKIVFVQPIQAPYWTERLKILSQNNDLEIFLLLERESFDSRPGWQPEVIPGVKTIVLNSQVRSWTVYNRDMGYIVPGVRTIPWHLSKTLTAIKPDVVVVCNATQLLCALPARWKLGFTLSLIVEDTLHSTRNQGRLQFILKKLAYKRADTWMPVNQDAKLFLNGLGIIQNIYPSSWSVDCEKFIPSPTAILESGRRVISMAGALTERKGVMQLLHAWNSIPRSRRQNFELRIAGTGSLQKVIEDYIQENSLDDVILLGQIPYGEIIHLFQSSSLSVLPTLEDVYGMVVLEAMACGCPVVTTPYAGARELVKDGVTGWIVDPMDNNDFVNKLVMAMSNTQHLNEMGMEAREQGLAHETYNVMETFAQQLIDMPKKLSL